MDKTQSKVRWLAHHVGLSDGRSSLEEDVATSPDREPPPDLIHFKTMEKFVGFLVYVAGTYTMFVLYLKRTSRENRGRLVFAWVQTRSFGSSKG